MLRVQNLLGYSEPLIVRWSFLFLQLVTSIYATGRFKKIVWQIMAVETKSCGIRSSFIQSQQTYRDLPNQVSQTFWVLQRGRIIQKENLMTLKNVLLFETDNSNGTDSIASYRTIYQQGYSWQRNSKVRVRGKSGPEFCLHISYVKIFKSWKKWLYNQDLRLQKLAKSI